MRDFSKINPSVWSSKRFMSLDDAAKLFYFYCLSSPLSNSCGCYRMPLGYIMEDLNWSKKQIDTVLDTVSKTGLIQYDFAESVLYIDRWYDFNAPNNPKHCLKVISELSSVPKSPLRTLNAKALRDFIDTKTWDKENVLSKLKPMLSDTVSDTVSRLGDTETETETKTETKTDIHGDAPCEDIDAALKSYNDVAEKFGLPIAQVLSDTRKKKLRARLKDCGGVDGWRLAMDLAQKSDFLMGKGKDGWKASLDFFLQQSSFIKLMEGTYDAKRKSSADRNRERLSEWAEQVPVDG